MIYKLLLYENDGIFLGIFPELDFISGKAPTKEGAKDLAIEKAAEYLKSLDSIPQTMELSEILSIAPDGSEKAFRQYLGIEFN